MPARIDVQETKEKASLNTPGGAELLKRMGGDGSLPYFAFLDAHGETIVNSNRPGDNGKPAENIGHPGEPQEVDWFLSMVRKAAPQITTDEFAALEHYLRNQKK